MPFVLSTATCSQKFVEYTQATPGGVHTPIRHVLIKGGANTASGKSGWGDISETSEGKPLWTPSGVVTKVTEEQVKFLESQPTFQRAVAKGYYKVLADNPGDSHAQVKKVVEAELTGRDSSAPMTPESAQTQIKVTTNLDLDKDE